MKEISFHKVSEFFPLMSELELKELAEDIKVNGLKEPITLFEGKIVDGRNRYLACLKAGIEPVFVEWKEKSSLVDFVVSMNLRRRHLTESQKACAAVEVLSFFEKEAKERMSKGGKGVELIPQLKGKARDQAGKIIGVSGRYVADAKKIKEKLPEEFELIKAGKKKITEIVRKLKKKSQLEGIKNLELPEGKFNVIVMDPPWKFGGYDPDGLRGEGDYPVMEIEEIKKIKIPAADDCILWLWGVDLLLKETLDLIEFWGFERKSTLIWVKDKMGLGHWLRNQHEYCFLCVKGKPVFHGENVPSVLHASRRKHSEKPEEFYEIVEKASPYKKKLDYFSRKQRKNWQCFGDEIDA